jgi:hypothetical protein
MWGVVAGARSRVKKTEVMQPVKVNKKMLFFSNNFQGRDSTPIFAQNC